MIWKRAKCFVSLFTAKERTLVILFAKIILCYRITSVFNEIFFFLHFYSDKGYNPLPRLFFLLAWFLSLCCHAASA